MNIEQLRHIVEVSKTHSILIASKQLNITQSALSQSITKLEKELNLKLFKRSRTGTTPTDMGEILLKKAVETLIKVDEFKMLSLVDSKQVTGSLKVGTIPGTAMFLPKALANYKKELPQIKIDITESSSQHIMDSIKHHELDVGLIGLTKEGKEKTDKDITLQVVLQGKIIAAASRTSRFGMTSKISPEDLLKTSIVLYQDDRLTAFADDFSNQFGQLNIFFTTNNMDAVRSAVLEDLAITLGPDYTIKSDPFVKSGDIIPLSIDQFPHNYPGMALVYLKNQKHSPILEPFVQKLSNELSTLS